MYQVIYYGKKHRLSAQGDVTKDRRNGTLLRGQSDLQQVATTASGGEAYFALRWNGGFGTDSSPSRGDPCRRTFRPTEASKDRTAMSALRRHQPSAPRKQRSLRDVANVSNRHLASVSTRTQKSASSGPSCCWQPASPRFQSTRNFESHSFRLYRGATVTSADIDTVARPPLRLGIANRIGPLGVARV